MAQSERDINKIMLRVGIKIMKTIKKFTRIGLVLFEFGKLISSSFVNKIDFNPARILDLIGIDFSSLKLMQVNEVAN
jgi:hypothetical protein